MQPSSVLPKSSTKGRCRSTAFTLAGFHRAASDVHVVAFYPGSRDLLRVRRDSLGRIVALDPLGEVFCLQHVKDATKLQELFAEAGVSWDMEALVLDSTFFLSLSPQMIDDFQRAATGYSRLVAEATPALLDEEVLSGNYPSDMPEATRKAVGAFMATFAKAPGVSKNDLRQARSYLVNQLWRRDLMDAPDSITTHMGTLRPRLFRVFPALAICGLPPEVLSLVRSMWDEALTYSSPAANPFSEVDYEPLLPVYVPPVFNLAVASGVSKTAADMFTQQLGPLFRQARTQETKFSTFLQAGLRCTAKPSSDTSLDPPMPSYLAPLAYTSPSGHRTRSFEPPAEFSNVSEQLMREVYSSLTSIGSTAGHQARPGNHAPDVVWCHFCDGPCRCPSGSEALVNMHTNGPGGYAHYEYDEHRWGSAHAIKPTARFKKRAAEFTPQVEERLKAVLADQYDSWLSEQAPGVHEDIALLLAQSGATPEDLSAEFVLVTLQPETYAATDRTRRVHAGWGPRFQELEELASSEPLTAVFLGRDGIYGFWAFEEFAKAGAIDTDKVNAVYVGASRSANARSIKKLKRLSADGTDLVYVDTGFNGTIPARLDAEVFGGTVTPLAAPPPNTILEQTDDPTVPRPFFDYYQKNPNVRLLSSGNPSKTFAAEIFQDTAYVIEHDAKEHRSSSVATLGFDAGSPTSAFEQFVARRLQASIREQAKKEAAELTPLSDEAQARTYYTPLAVNRFREQGLSFADIAACGRQGLSPFTDLSSRATVSNRVGANS